MLKNCFGPEQTLHIRKSVGEGEVPLLITGAMTESCSLGLPMFAINQAHKAEQPGQAGTRAEYRAFFALPSRLKARMVPHLAEGDFDVPAPSVTLDDLPSGQVHLGGREVFVAADSGIISDEHPAYRNPPMSHFNGSCSPLKRLPSAVDDQVPLLRQMPQNAIIFHILQRGLRPCWISRQMG